jgi:hypothetical protein
VVVWVIGLSVGILGVAYWNGEAEDSILGWYNEPDDSKEWSTEDIQANQRANTMILKWAIATILWGVVGLVVLYWVWQREER